MYEVNRILKVPPQSEVRNDLRAWVHKFVSERQIQPPASLEALELFAATILDDCNLNHDFLDFTMVLLGNEIWRKTVAATPYNRRLLLLPQCLRNDNLCQGVFDEWGLICSGCKNCRIDSVLEKAERLGYTTLVAEGTTVALRLVEEGAIDAVIGVSCMQVLQRSFGPVTRAALPGIGIPLIGDGCSNTMVDYGWLFEEMENFIGTNNHTPLSVSLLKTKVTDYFQPPVLDTYFNATSETEKLSQKVLGMGGQRMRPLLAVMAYYAYSANPLEEIGQTLAMVIECFHKASLVHDDIEDDDDMRYGEPVLHKTDGIPVAINVGDYLIGKGYSLLSGLPLKAETLSECFSITAASHVKLSEGQGADLTLKLHLSGKTVDDLLQIFRLKTGEAVKVALLTGAAAGEASQAEKDVLGRFSEMFGIAYQIRDDLTEYREEQENYDLYDSPFMLALLQQEMQEDMGTVLNGQEKNDNVLFREYCQRYDVEKKAEEYLIGYINKCYQELHILHNQKLKLGLYGVMGKVYKDQSRG